MAARSGRNGASRHFESSVFLNFPYDNQFNDLFLAYLVGVCSFGLTPRTTLEIPGGEQRLRRIASLVRSCRFSFHDLSRVELDRRNPPTPRFNMPFEAGLAVMHALQSGKHTFFVFEKSYRRVQKSLSDLGGSDIYSHGGKVNGVLREISNALVGGRRRPSAPQMQATLKAVKRALPEIMKQAGSETPYSARVFADLVVFTNEMVRMVDMP